MSKHESIRTPQSSPGSRGRQPSVCIRTRFPSSSRLSVGGSVNRQLDPMGPSVHSRLEFDASICVGFARSNRIKARIDQSVGRSTAPLRSISIDPCGLCRLSRNSNFSSNPFKERLEPEPLLTKRVPSRTFAGVTGLFTTRPLHAVSVPFLDAPSPCLLDSVGGHGPDRSSPSVFRSIGRPSNHRSAGRQPQMGRGPF